MRGLYEVLTVSGRHYDTLAFVDQQFVVPKLRPVADTELVPRPQHLLGFRVHVLLDADARVLSLPDRLDHLLHEPADHWIFRLGFGHFINMVSSCLRTNHGRGVLELIESADRGRDRGDFSPCSQDP